MILARYDVVLDQPECMHLYSHRQLYLSVIIIIISIIIFLKIFSLPNFSIDVAGSKTDSDVTKKKSTLPFGFSVDSKDAAGMTRLMNAVVHVNIQAVKSLIEIGANPSLTSDKGWNALHFAAQVGDIGIIDVIQDHFSTEH